MDHDNTISQGACPEGHPSEPILTPGTRPRDKKEWDRQWRIRNKEHLKEKARLRYIENKEAIDRRLKERLRTEEGLIERRREYLRRYRQRPEVLAKERDPAVKLHKKKLRQMARTRRGPVELTEAQKELKRNYTRRYREKHRGEIRNKTERAKDYQREWRAKNVGKCQAYSRLRQARKKNALCPSANKKFIAQIYETSERISTCLGIRFHVDHIRPLARGGLHHENNLQVIPAALNWRKSYTWEPSDTT